MHCLSGILGAEDIHRCRIAQRDGIPGRGIELVEGAGLGGPLLRRLAPERPEQSREGRLRRS